jgi:hypothetical protein
MGPIELVYGNRRGAFAERFKMQQRVVKESQDKMRAPDSHLLSLQIDVTRPPKELISEILSAIRLHRDKLSRAGLLAVATKRARRRLDQYSVYIRVWDLRQNGRAFREIAQQIYPKEYPNHPAPKNPIIQRVTDHFRRAKALIHGGYKELT